MGFVSLAKIAYTRKRIWEYINQLIDNDEYLYNTGTGDMNKSTYDADDDGIVDKAEMLDDGGGNTATASQVAGLLDDSMQDSSHRHSELSGNDGSPNPALKVDADGNIGIGTTNPLNPLHIQGDATVVTSGMYGLSMGYVNADRAWIQAGNGILTLNEAGGNVAIGGNVGIGVSPSSSYPLYVYRNSVGYGMLVQSDDNNAACYGIAVEAGADNGTGNTYYLDCYDGDGNRVGYIWNTSGTFQLVDVSDERLKKDIVDTKINALKIINDIRVVDFKFKNKDDKNKTGFLAQQLLEVYEKAVAKGKNEDDIMGTARAELIPVLVKALQEQQEIIDYQGQQIEELWDSLSTQI